MSAGNGACPVVGNLTVALKSIALPLASTWTEILVLVTVPVTASGIGFAPRMYFSACLRISCRRQRQSAFDDTRVPSSFTNGSGNFVDLGKGARVRQRADGAVGAFIFDRAFCGAAAAAGRAGDPRAAAAAGERAACPGAMTLPPRPPLPPLLPAAPLFPDAPAAAPPLEPPLPPLAAPPVPGAPAPAIPVVPDIPELPALPELPELPELPSCSIRRCRSFLRDRRRRRRCPRLPRQTHQRPGRPSRPAHQRRCLRTTAPAARRRRPRARARCARPATVQTIPVAWFAAIPGLALGDRRRTC